MSDHNTNLPPREFLDHFDKMEFNDDQIVEIYARLARISSNLEDKGTLLNPAELLSIIIDINPELLRRIAPGRRIREAEKIAFEMLSHVESHISILYNHVRNELMTFDSWQTLSPDAELCKTLGLETNTKAGWLTLLIKPALVELKRQVIENSKDRMLPKFAFKELVFQICDSQDSGTLKAVQKVIFDDQLLYTEEEMAILDKVFQTRKKKSLLTS